MLLAGEVGKPHGLAGEVYVVVISDDPRRFAAGSVLHRDDGTQLIVAAARSHGDRFLVTFEGVTTRADAVGLRGPLYVPAVQRRSLDSDEFWHDDLVGCSVSTPDGIPVGTVTGVLTGPAQDLLRVDTAAGERLIPVVKQIVVSVDTASKTILVDPPAGLLD